jgi:hypothetical protein
MLRFKIPGTVEELSDDFSGIPHYESLVIGAGNTHSTNGKMIYVLVRVIGSEERNWHARSKRDKTRNAYILKSAMFWNVTPSSPVEISQCFGDKYCPHLQGRRVSQARNL